MAPRRNLIPGINGSRVFYAEFTQVSLIGYPVTHAFPRYSLFGGWAKAGARGGWRSGRHDLRPTLTPYANRGRGVICYHPASIYLQFE